MKNVKILMMIVFVLLVSGCQKSKVQPLEDRSVTPEAKTSEESKPAEAKVAEEAAPQAPSIAGNYQGSTKGTDNETPCIDFVVEVSGTGVKGTATGAGMVNCNLTFSGTVDHLGNMEGQANATYTQVAKGATFEFYLSGPFSGALKDNGGALAIELKGTGHSCPPNIPCVDEPDSITVALQRK